MFPKDTPINKDMSMAFFIVCWFDYIDATIIYIHEWAYFDVLQDKGMQIVENLKPELA